VLIAKDIPVTSVAHQLGHANAGIMLSIYGHLLDAAEHEERVAAALEAAALGGKAAENGGGERRRTDHPHEGRMSPFIPPRRVQAISG
jgi:hypothetical protein